MSLASRTLTTLAAGLVMAAPAFAGLSVTPGNVEQKKCGASRLEPLTASGTLVRGGMSLSVIDRRLNVGKPLNAGDVLFYASLAEARKVYRTEKQIEIIDGSPLTPDVRLTPQQELPVIGSFTPNNGRRFDLVAVGGGYNRFLVMVDDAGFMCSHRLDDKLVAVGNPTVYQELALVSATADLGLAKPRTQSVAVTFLGLSGASASFEVATMVNGVVEAKKVASFDAFAPEAQIGDLRFAIKVDEGKLIVGTLNEPTDYLRWLGELRAGMRR